MWMEGLYYSYKGAVYLAKADMPNWAYPPDTAGLWQWEKVKVVKAWNSFDNSFRG